MLAKHVYLQNDDKQTRYPHKFVYAPEWISLDSSQNLDSKKWISSDSLYANKSETAIMFYIKTVHQDFPE